MWEKEEIDVNRFPDGLTQEHIFYVPSDSPKVKSNQAVSEDPELLQASQYVPIIKVVLERSRPLTAEEKELAKDKKYGKTLEKLGSVVAAQEEFQESCSGNGNLVLNAIAWQISQGVDPQADKN